MDYTNTEKQTTTSELESAPNANVGPVYDVGEKVDYDRAGAINAEDLEHEMTVLQAVRAYPAASWWAFVMSCTIVRVLLIPEVGLRIISLTLQ